MVCNRDEPNGATTFTLSGNIGGFTNVTITTVNNASNGDGPETIKSIKYNTDRDYTSQDRAVTAEIIRFL